MKKDVKGEDNYKVGISASGGHQPTPLLGATLRSLELAGKVTGGRGGGLFGAGEIGSSGTSAFSMTLQIP